MASSKTPKSTMVGDNVLKHVCDLSGKRDAGYTTSVAKGTEGLGSSPTGTAKVRGRKLINEANGPAFHINATLYKQNAAAANDAQRKLRILQPAVKRSASSSVSF